MEKFKCPECNNIVRLTAMELMEIGNPFCPDCAHNGVEIEMEVMDNEVYEVVDSEFNQANYKDLIGNRYTEPPAYVQVKEDKCSWQLIGLSLSSCIKAIVNHEYVTNDVLFIITGTKIKSDWDEKEVLERYKFLYWNTLNHNDCLDVYHHLRNNGQLIQPRNYSAYLKVNPTFEASTSGIWTTPKKLIDRMINRAKKIVNDIERDWNTAFIPDYLNQLESANQWLRLLDDYSISPNPIENEFVQDKRKKQLGLNL